MQDTPRSSRKGLQSCVNLGDEGGFGSPIRGSFPRRQAKDLGQVLQILVLVGSKQITALTFAALGPGVSWGRKPEPRFQNSKPLLKA